MKALLSLVFLFFCNPLYAKNITIASDIWCPYVCNNQENPGYIVEIINDILQNANFNVKNETMPLARALKYLQNAEVDLVLGVTKQHIDHYLLTANHVAIGSFANDFFVQNNNPWRFTTINNLAKQLHEGRKVGIIKGYFYGHEIKALIDKYPDSFIYAHGDYPLQQLIERLKSGRIDILLDSKNTVFNLTKQANISELGYAGTQGKETKLYLGLSKPREEQLLSIIDKGIVKYRQTGKLDQLLLKYGINDWH